MSSSSFFLLSLLALVSLVLSPCSGLSIPNAITSNMVLQRAPQSARIWGEATPSSPVTITLDSTSYSTFTSPTGSWLISLPPHPASPSHTLTITGDSTTITLTNIAFGDVYYCSGQSNMEYALQDTWGGNATIKDATHYPHLRLFTIAKAASLTPLTNTTNRWGHTGWVVTAPQWLSGPSFEWFSAVCYYFGRPLYEAVNQGGAVVPIGLIDSCWSASLIEAWTTMPALEQCGPIRFPAYNSSEPTRSTRIGNANSTALFNGMVAPVLHMAMRGVVWYQGESNANAPDTYACRLVAMIEDWRAAFNNYRLSFYVVLLTALKSEGIRWAVFRDAQLNALTLPYTAVASGVDLGDQVLPAGPGGAGHSRNKTDLGRRLALAALRVDYTTSNVTQGPQLADVVWPLGGSVQTVVLRFQGGDAGAQGLLLRDTSDCDVCCGGGLAGSPMTVATSDGRVGYAEVRVYAAAYAVLATVEVKAGAWVTGVAFNWDSYAQCSLYNAANIPINPFNFTRSSLTTTLTPASL